MGEHFKSGRRTDCLKKSVVVSEKETRSGPEKTR